MAQLTVPVQTETYEVAPGQDSNHGYSGPLKVSYAGVFTNIGKDFLEVGAKYDPTRSSTDDPNGIFEPYVNKYGVRTFMFLYSPLFPLNYCFRDGKSMYPSVIQFVHF